MSDYRNHTVQMSPKAVLRASLPKPVYELLRVISKQGDILRFVVARSVRLGILKKLWLLWRFYHITCRVQCEHTHGETLAFAQYLLSLDPNIPGCIVEAGCYKGGSTAKFSLVARLSKRKLIIFDSFEGIPENNEPHSRNIFGKPAGFARGAYCGSLEEVKEAVKNYGDYDVCVFVKGWFQDTLPTFHQPVAAAYLDVDLVSSTQTCLKHLWPVLSPGGALFSQDGHLPLVIELLKDERFWQNEIGVSPPPIDGLGVRQLIKIERVSGPE